MHIFDFVAVRAVHHIFEQTIARRHQLAEPRACSLECPGHREALLEQITDIIAQHELVDRIILETPANENRAGPAQHETETEKIQIDATKNMNERQVILISQVSGSHTVYIGFVRKQQQRRMFPHGLAQPGQLLAVKDDLVFIALRQHEPVELGLHVDKQRAGPGDQFLHIFGGLLVQCRFALPGIAGKPGHGGTKSRIAAQAVGDMPRYLVATAPQSALGNIQHQASLSHHEGSKFGIVGLGIILAELGKALFQLADRSGLTGQAMSPTLVPQQNRPGPKTARISGIAEYDMAHPYCSAFFEIRNSPGNANRHHQRVGTSFQFFG